MSNIKEKENDWIVSLALNKDLGLSDFSDMGLTADNTQLQSRDYYKNKKFIQDNFKTESGAFDEVGFNKFYDGAAKSFTAFNSGDYKEGHNLIHQMEHTYSNLFHSDDSKLKEYNFNVKKVSNPFLEKRGTLGMGSIEDSNLSISEIAQRGKIIDHDSGETLDYSANDSGGLNSFFRDPLVLAQWDEDGIHTDFETGREVTHKAGDYRLNENGELCYETLGNRDASTKQFLSSFDTITVDGSLANNFDIFDADDKEQNITKTIARAALKYAPVALGAAASGGILPTISAVYLGVTALMNLGESLPSLYKAIEGVSFGGDGDPKKKGTLWNAMNSLEARAKQYRFGSSEYSKNNTFTIENLVNLIADVSIQLGQQTTIAQIPKYLGLDKSILKSAKTIDDFQRKTAKFNKFSRNLATAYMTITSGADAYGRAKAVGHDDRMAGLITLGTLFGLHKVMMSEVGQWPLKGIGLDDLRIAAKPILTAESKRLADAIGSKAIVETSEIAKKKIIKETSSAVYNWLKNFIDEPQKMVPAMLNETIEEISEEMVGDFNMAMGAAASALGVTRKVDTSFSLGDVAQRYAMAGFGGAIGGGIHRLRTPWTKAHAALENGEENNKLINLVWEYGADAICEEIDNEYKSDKLVGDKNLSSTKSEVINNEINYLTADGEEDTQAFAIKEGLKNLVRTYEELLTRSGSVSKDVDTRKALMNLQDPEVKKLFEFGLEERVSKHISYYNKQIIEMSKELADLDDSSKEFNPINQKLADLKSQKEEILNGQHFDHYFQQGLLYLNDTARDLFIHADKDKFSIHRTGKKFEDLSEFDKRILLSEYADYNESGEKSMQLEYAVDIMNETLKKMAPYNEKYGDEFYNISKRTKDVLSNSINLAQERLNIFDKNGEIIPSRKAEILGENGMPINVLDKPLYSFKEGEDVDEKQILSGIISNIQALTEGGVPLDMTTAKEINRFRSKIVSGINSYSKKNVSKHFYNMFPNLFWADMPGVSKLNFDSEASVADIDEAIKDVKSASDEDFLNAVDDNNFTNDLSLLIENKVLPEELDADEMSDSEKVKYLREAVIKSLSDARASLQTNYANYFEFLDIADKSTKSVQRNPIYDYLDAVSDITGSDNKPLFDLLREESVRLENTAIDEYFVNNPERLAQIKKDIEIAKSLIAMTLNTPEYNGYGTILNKFRSKYGNLDEIPLINQDVAVHMIDDLEDIESKIDFFIKLSNYNLSDRLREQKRSAAKFYELFSEVLSPDATNKGAILAQVRESNPEIDLLKGDDGLLLELDAIKDSLNDELTLGSINDDTLSKAELLLSKVESLIHNNFKELSKTHSNSELLKSIFNENTLSFSKDKDSFTSSETTDISSNKDTRLTDFDKAVYLTSLFASDSVEFKSRMYAELSKTTKDEEGNEVPVYKFAPLFAQEYPCRLAFGVVENPELFNQMLSLMKDNNGRRQAPMLQNIMYIIGYHGTGKTSATANLIHSILKTKYGENYATVSSIVDRQTKKFKESLGEEGQAYTKEQLLNEALNGNSISDFTDETKRYDEDGFVLEEKLKKLEKNTKIGKVIYIDEVTWYSAEELAVLTEWARLNDVVIIALGDNLQQGAGKDIAFFDSVKSPVIEYSMRAGSTITKDNADLVRTLTKGINELDHDEVSRRKIQKYFKDNWNKNNTIKYHIDKDGLIVGTKTINRDQYKDIEAFVDSILKAKIDPSNVAIIYESEDDVFYKDLENLAKVHKFNMVKLSEMQGSEFDYVISTINVTPPVKNKSDYFIDYAKKINTLLSRAKYGNLIVGDFGLANSSVKYNNILKFDEDKLSEFRDAKLNSLKAISEGSDIQNTEPEKKSEETKKEKSKLKTTSDNDVDKAVQKAIEKAIKGENPETDESSKIEDVGKDKNDGQVLSYSAFVSFGGVIKRGKLSIPKSRAGLKFDLQMFKNPDSDKIGAYDIDDDNFYELLQKLDLLKKEILLNDKSIDELIKTNEFKTLANSVKNDYDWSKAEFKIVYTKRNLELDHNYEINNKYDNPSNMIARLCLMVPSNEGLDGVITLAEVGSKDADKAFKVFNDKAKSVLSKSPNSHYIIHVDKDAIKKSGISTRILKTKDRTYTLDELKDDYSWKNMSGVMIFTGRTEAITSLMDVENDEELINMIEQKIEDYNINGRPVMFISKDPKTKGWTSNQLAKQFWLQKKYMIERDINPNVKPVEHLVNMVVLDANALTGEEFFEELDSILDSFKEDKEGASKRINTLAHKFVGLNMIKNLYEYRQYINDQYFDKKSKKYNFPNKEESYRYNNINAIIKFMEFYFGVMPKTVTRKVDGKDVRTIEIAFKTGKLGSRVANPQNEEMLNSAIDEINKAHKDGTDARKIIYDEYYNSSKREFNFSDLLVALYDITRESNSKLLEKSTDEYNGGNEYHTINQSYALKNLLYVLNESPVARFPKGFEFHPMYKSKNDSDDATNYVEECWVDDNAESIFSVGTAIIESQRVLIDFNKVIDQDKKAENDELKEKELKEAKLKSKQEIDNLDIDEKTKKVVKDSIDKADNINDIQTFIEKGFGSIKLILDKNTDGEVVSRNINGKQVLVFEKTTPEGVFKRVIKSIDKKGAFDIIIFDENEPGYTEPKSNNDEGKSKATKKSADFGVKEEDKKSNKKEGPADKKSSKEKIEEEKDKITKYGEDTINFINGIDDTLPFKKHLVEALDLKSSMSFDDYAKLIKLLRDNYEPIFKKLSDLMNNKLDIIC